MNLLFKRNDIYDKHIGNFAIKKKKKKKKKKKGTKILIYLL